MFKHILQHYTLLHLLHLLQSSNVVFQFSGYLSNKFNIIICENYCWNSAASQRHHLSSTHVLRHTLHIIIIPFEAILGEHENSIYEVTQVIEKLSVVLQDKVSPTEGTILSLRPHKQQIESIDICWYPSLHGIISKHPNTTTLGKLSIFVVQVLCETFNPHLYSYQSTPYNLIFRYT